MAQELSPPKKDGDVTVYEIEVTEEDLECPIEVPMEEPNTRLVVRLRRAPILFSL